MPSKSVCFITALLLPGLVVAEDPNQPEMPAMHSPIFWGVQFEEFEFRLDEDSNTLGVWNADAFVGTDEFKVRWLSNGEYADQDNAFETLENHLVGQIPVSTFFDAKVGVRFDTAEGPDRTYALIGLVGLAPYWFELDTNVYVSDEGDFSADFDAEYELLFTNRLILTTSLDVDIAFSEDSEIGLGKGLSKTELGFRLRYDLIDRSFSPYIGVVQEQRWGDTADLIRNKGGKTHDLLAVIGAKLMF
jgi:copper resistance protein B